MKTQNLEISFFSLLKNNGLFKSEKQAKFLSQFLEGNTFTTMIKRHNLGSDYNYKNCGSSQHVFTLDSKGITKVIKINSTNKTVLYWERKDQQVFLKEQQEKQDRLNTINNLDSKLKRTIKAIDKTVKKVMIKVLSDNGIVDQKTIKIVLSSMTENSKEELKQFSKRLTLLNAIYDTTQKEFNKF